MSRFAPDEAAGIGLAFHGSMLGHILSASSEARSLPVTVASDRALTRELLVDFLRRHGFPQTNGQVSLRAALGASAREGPELLFVDLANDHEDARQLLRELRLHRPEAATIAIGTPMQLAAQAGEADGWIDVSEPTTRVIELASTIVRMRCEAPRIGSPVAERLSRTWRMLTNRQGQVLALLGCGADNHKVARTLGISERAVKAHVSALLDKFKADNRTELAVIACQANLRVPSRSIMAGG